ncbi:MAG: calcium/sodium antiporter [Thiomicrorhabdus chilensis]|uniref:calcium/sodium antiporter n=1 Tax=Thiomicrorhabdus chilensis TaxID=63656 RepID=UPI00299E1660|nr:calcium/sodium antiporter [Thiomicrorhabdus chilensis]MDX1347381.1 calcium/sodium antiporter [Thiomicrorhabdus chilensis]
MAISLLIPGLALIIGLAFLVWSSDVFIDGSASTATHLSISPLVIGVVVLGFGTSMPEVVVATLASLDNSPGLAVGNAIGSNIANIGLVLGFTAVLAPIAIKSSLIKRELPVLLAISVGVYLLLLDGTLGFVDGLILVSALILVMVWMIKVNKAVDPKDPLASETSQAIDTMPAFTLNKSLLMLLVGLIILMISAKLMVWGAVEIAHHFQVPEVIIGLTIIAIGTSLPELAAAIAAARKNEADLMIGNIVGSNLFNILAVLAVPGLLAPSVLEPSVLKEDIPVMIGFTLAMLLLALPRKGHAVISKPKGLLLTLAFAIYLFTLYIRSTSA